MTQEKRNLNRLIL